MIIAFGLGVGVLIGLTGIGGGSLMTPLLVIVAGIKPTVAIGTDLAYGAVTKTVGGWRHWRKGTVDFGVSGWLALGSIPGSIAGVWALERLALDTETLLLAVAGALVVVALAILARALFMPKLVAKERHSVEMSRGIKVAAVAIGLVLGFILGFTSVGSGALVGLALIVVFKLTPHRVVGTDVFHAAVLLWVAGFAHFLSGNVDFALMANILLGSVPGVWFGSGLVTKVPAHGLRIALGCVLLGSALGVASKAGIAIPPGLIISVPLGVGVLAWLIERGRPPRLPEAPSEPVRPAKPPVPATERA
ncbi:MAG TPA: sulfite exporter TauE/SafE family protein [Thermoleophilaceae bacterium]|nr:sulfite exporter TauE/SafE family protein [Thermoleophilaceae bacterium]